MILLILGGCRNEGGRVDVPSDASAGEKAYFEDYISPEFKWGVIDVTGDLVIKDIYDDIRDFNDGVAWASYLGKWGLIDEQGSVLIQHQYLNASDFSDGLALVRDFDGKKYYVDSQGKKVVDCLFQECYDFIGGVAIFEANGNKGLINKKGEIAVEPKFQALSYVDGGYFLAKERDSYGLLDMDGQWTISAQYDKLYKPVEGILRYKNDGKYGFIDLSGSSVLNVYEWASDFQEGYAAVKLGNRHGLINLEGNFRPVSTDKIKPNGNGSFLVKKENKLGLVLSDGSTLVNFDYDTILRYKSGMAGFSKNDRWGYFNDKGEVVINPSLPIIWDYSEGLCRIITKNGYAYLDKDTKMVIAPKFYEARDFKNGFARVQLLPSF